jgi:lambda repressor-like predicted transcriptional regulator
MRRELTQEELKNAGLGDKVFQPAPDGGMSRSEIRRALLCEGFTLKGLEQTAGFHEGAVNQALTKRYPKVDRLIAAVLKKDVKEIWPSQYPDDEEPEPELHGVRKALHEKGVTPAQIEREFGLTKGSVVNAISRRSPKIDEIIAGVLEKPVWEIWPDRYLISGVPVPLIANTAEKIAKFNEHIRQAAKHSLPPGVRLKSDP